MTASITYVSETLDMMVDAVRGVPLGPGRVVGAWETGHALDRPDGVTLGWFPDTYSEAYREDYARAAAHFSNWSPPQVVAVANLGAALVRRAESIVEAMPGSPLVAESVLAGSLDGWTELLALCKVWRGSP